MVGDSATFAFRSKLIPSEFIDLSPPQFRGQRPQSPPAFSAPSREWPRAQRAVDQFPLCDPAWRRCAPWPTAVRDRPSPGAKPWSARSCDKSCLRGVRIFPVRWSRPSECSKKIFRLEKSGRLSVFTVASARSLWHKLQSVIVDVEKDTD